jgi:hypothetical protein
MEARRERVVSMLSHVLHEFDALKHIHSGYDDVAVETIARVEPVVRKVLDHFALPADAPLEESAAQNLRSLAAHMRAIANASTSEKAKRDIEHEATRIDVFITIQGTMLGVYGETFAKTGS